LIEDENMPQEPKDLFNPLRWWLENRPWEKDRVTGLTGLSREDIGSPIKRHLSREKSIP